MRSVECAGAFHNEAGGGQRLIDKQTVIMSLTLLRLCRAFFGHGDSGDFLWENWGFNSGLSVTHFRLCTFSGNLGFC